VKARRRLAAAAAAGAKERTVIARNRRARHDYHIEDVVEAGLVLTGTEVKSLRAGRASLTDGFAQISDGEMWLYGVHIPEYAQGTWTQEGNRQARKRNRGARLHPCAALAVLHRRESEGRTGAGPRQADLR
jgi:SsrA-binding protein